MKGGAEGLEDRRLGRASARAVPVDEALEMVTLYETRYTGWTVKHFHERWQGAWRDALVYVDEEPAASHRTGRASAPARGASQEAAPQTLARHDAPSRRLDP
jgi:hypothetical protein